MVIYWGLPLNGDHLNILHLCPRGNNSPDPTPFTPPLSRVKVLINKRLVSRTLLPTLQNPSQRDIGKRSGTRYGRKTNYSLPGSRRDDKCRFFFHPFQCDSKFLCLINIKNVQAVDGRGGWRLLSSRERKFIG